MLRLLSAFAMSLTIFSSFAGASDVEWKLALSSSNAGVSQPQLPDSHALVHARLADAGSGLLGFQLRPIGSQTVDGNWFEHGAIFSRYAALNEVGSLGPGRSGAESSHVFRRLYDGDSIGAGINAFGATASAPGAANAGISQGVWVSDGSHNTEIARVGSDGALGPGLGNGVYYKNLHHVDSTEDIDVRMLPDGRVLFAGRIGTDSNLGADGLSLYEPGSGNRPCMLSGASDSEFGPGIAAKFNSPGARPSVSPRGEVYDYATLSSTPTSPPGFYGAQGFWQFCDGAPRLAVLTGVVGEFGPGLSDNGARFGGELNGLNALSAPGQPGSFYFTSGGRMSDNTIFLGLFLHDRALGRNVPILLEDDDNTYGPQIPGFVFNTATIPYHVVGAGKYAVLNTSILATGTTSPRTYGLWRLVAGGNVEPVAIADNTGAYAPASGRVWTGTFYEYAVFDSGDIVTLAETRNVSNASTANSWWRLRPGETPVEILKVGDLVQVSTPSGVINKAVTSIDHASSITPSQGRDTWYSANGTIIVNDITIQGFAGISQSVRGVAARSDLIFANDFD